MQTPSPSPPLAVRRLAWAGVELVSGNTKILIDPLERIPPSSSFLGAPRRALRPVEMDSATRTHALITHLHGDHYDPQLLRRVDGTVVCHQPIAQRLGDDGLDPTALGLGTTLALGPFTVTAVSSLDWRGDDQVAWVVSLDGQRFIHCGDTIWHGSWWSIAREHGPFDIAFLPINGVIASLDTQVPANVPATLTPEQAIEAAHVLGATTACAIHYDLFHNPPVYVEQPNVAERFAVAAAARNVTPLLPTDDTPVTLAPRATDLLDRRCDSGGRAHQAGLDH